MGKRITDQRIKVVHSGSYRIEICVEGEWYHYDELMPLKDAYITLDYF